MLFFVVMPRTFLTLIKEKKFSAIQIIVDDPLLVTPSFRDMLN